MNDIAVHVQHVQEIQLERQQTAQADSFARKHALTAAWLSWRWYWEHRGRVTKAEEMQRLHRLCRCLDLWKAALVLSCAMQKASVLEASVRIRTTLSLFLDSCKLALQVIQK